MKRISIWLSILTAMFLALCFVEASARGLNPPLEWDLQPAWWQSNLLAEFGWWLAAPSLYIFGVTASHVLLALSLIVTMMSASVIVFYVTRASVRTRRA